MRGTRRGITSPAERLLAIARRSARAQSTDRSIANATGRHAIRAANAVVLGWNTGTHDFCNVL